jgi:AcrR family transcriptional regulator
VAEAAGVSRRTVFRHFATRDALFVTVIRAGVRRYAEQLPAAPAPGGDLSGWLAGLLVVTVTGFLWKGRGGPGAPPRWLVDAVAVQLSGFTTQSLAGDLGRTPDEVASVSAQVIEAALTTALASPSLCARPGPPDNTDVPGKP